jgi:hypothetical protein
VDIPIDPFALNYAAVALAAVSSMIVGTIWYLPAVFGRRFERLTGIDPTKPKRPAVTYAASFVASIVTASVLAYSTSLCFAHFGGPFALCALGTAILLWLGFTAARILVHDLFESRSIHVFFITAGHELVTALAMAAIIGLLGY